MSAIPRQPPTSGTTYPQPTCIHCGCHPFMKQSAKEAAKLAKQALEHRQREAKLRKGAKSPTSGTTNPQPPTQPHTQLQTTTPTEPDDDRLQLSARISHTKVSEYFATKKKEMPFGKYKGALISDIVKNDPDYARWVIRNTSASPWLMDEFRNALQKPNWGLSDDEDE